MFYTDCFNAIFIEASFLNQAIRTAISFFTRAHRASLFKACFEDFNRSKPSLVKHFFCNNSLKTNLTQHLMFQWIRRTSYATYFTFTGSYVDFSFWVLRRRHNIMPTRFLTLLRWSWMHHNLSVALKEHIFPEWKKNLCLMKTAYSYAVLTALSDSDLRWKYGQNKRGNGSTAYRRWSHCCYPTELIQFLSAK